MKLRHWVLGEFDDEAVIPAVVEKLREEGFRELETYSPYPLEGMSEKLKLGRSILPILTLAAALFGVVGMFVIEWGTDAMNYPIDVANRPAFSPPSFVPLAYEFGIVFSSSAVFFGMLLLLRLPRPHHPVMEIEAFRSATMDRYWVSVSTLLPNEAKAAEEALHRLGAKTVSTTPEKVYR